MKSKGKGKRDSMESNEITDNVFMVIRFSDALDDTLKDVSESLAQILIEQCFYNLKNRQLPLTLRQIINKCEVLYKFYKLDLLFLATHWGAIKIRIERIHSTKRSKNEYVWEGTKGPSPALDAIIKKLKIESMNNIKKNQEEEYYTCSSSPSSDEDSNETNEFKGIVHYL
ncbi:hypothetical protein RFI_07915 [Reticulomyxa filosa]|uniref:Uncharacterized protein n=1 Tax=Reticulomyxa filosa TaxID=46433 RepID=X6NVA1_RETFI|nr:hypothetical protein RFI_07915 [Reticulomyxa filosa]|eukprot:ETO29212.1 hypothetical protein RFI_07915 [Reticulomyxa filosa]